MNQTTEFKPTKFNEFLEIIDYDRKKGQYQMTPNALWLILRGKQINIGGSEYKKWIDGIKIADVSEEEFRLLVNAAIGREYTLEDINVLRRLHKGKKNKDGEDVTYLKGNKLNQIFSARFQPDYDYDKYWDEENPYYTDALIDTILDNGANTADDDSIGIADYGKEKWKEMKSNRRKRRLLENNQHLLEEKILKEVKDDKLIRILKVYKGINGGKKSRRKKRTRKRRKSRRKRKRK